MVVVVGRVAILGNYESTETEGTSCRSIMLLKEGRKDESSLQKMSSSFRVMPAFQGNDYVNINNNTTLLKEDITSLLELVPTPDSAAMFSGQLES